VCWGGVLECCGNNAISMLERASPQWSARPASEAATT